MRQKQETAPLSELEAREQTAWDMLYSKLQELDVALRAFENAQKAMSGVSSHYRIPSGLRGAIDEALASKRRDIPSLAERRLWEARVALKRAREREQALLDDKKRARDAGGGYLTEFERRLEAVRDEIARAEKQLAALG